MAAMTSSSTSSFGRGSSRHYFPGTVQQEAAAAAAAAAEDPVGGSLLQPPQDLSMPVRHSSNNRNDSEDNVDIIWDTPTRGRIRRRSSSLTSHHHHHHVNNNNDFKVQIPPAIYDLCAFFCDWTQAAMEVWIELLTAPPFPMETLHKVSIILLAMEIVRESVEESLIQQGTNHSDSSGGAGSASSSTTGALMLVFTTTTADASSTIMEGAGGEEAYWTLYSIPKYLIWAVPVVIALLSVSFAITLQLTWGHQEEAVIATALISLIFLEALLPLFILGCTSMFLFQQVSWEAGLALLVIVWLGSTFCAHCIRRMLYQSLGHG